ncbi:uncharacterized protein LOC110416241 [Herrania umbratica]|uniref:Uncharacterized protein LOC110416241 n=1 Tax=Herrania umbratica TaxID=108875 RepID=A0A6J1A9N0_9ROSI|nr:uncharacterized protein LOC110416241 [Herrania umbratica]XP_021283832.1 uncharacterized protein LOC110416241 [Herrania umbratica]XP_021283833.1 uncharacterized protein LOC110416241 [Herrania umbratica]
MWGFGGRYYWGRKERVERREGGIVVVFAWMSSQEKHLKNYLQLYASLGWDSLVCHSEFLNMFCPEKAAALALDLLKELVEELKMKPCPVVFASFSGGPKACMYKVLQMIDGLCEAPGNPDDLQLVKECFSGHIYDSSPVDFTSDLGARFVVHPTVLKMSHPPRIASWIANQISSGLDALFLSRFESQRAEYWQTLYASVRMGAPYLILCSETDDLAPYQIICNFAQRIEQLGGDIKLVKWNGSPHVGHYRHYPIEYKAAVTELLRKAAASYSQRIQRLEGERMGLAGTHDEISEPISNISKTVLSPNQSFQGTLVQRDHFLLPSSIDYYEGRDFGSVQDEHKEGLIRLPHPPSINVHGVLGQILFDVCVPQNVEGWDIKSSDSSSRHPYTSAWRNSHFNPIKCIRRSRL